MIKQVETNAKKEKGDYSLPIQIQPSVNSETVYKYKGVDN